MIDTAPAGHMFSVMTEPAGTNRPDPRTPPPDDAPGPAQPLVFRPDPRRARRIAAFRTTALLTTAVLIAGAGLTVFLYKPRFDVRQPQRDAAVPAAGGVVAPVQSAPSPPAASSADRDPVSSARRAVEGLRASRDRVNGLLRRAEELVHTVAAGPDEAARVAGEMRLALVLVDSAQAEIRSGLSLVEATRDASRAAGASLTAHRISIVTAAAGRYLAAAERDGSDRRLGHEALAAAFTALAQGDAAEYEVKLNVANGHRRRSETRQRALGRAWDAVEEADANVR